jgi:xylulokinase
MNEDRAPNLSYPVSKGNRIIMYLGIDCGTQGTKALLVDANGRSFGRGYAKHQIIESESGAREQKPEWWIDALRIAVSQAIAPSAEKVIAIGISGQQHGLVILDEKHRVIRPAKLWNDTETAAQNEQLIKRFGGRAEWFRRFGIVPLTGYTLSKLLWLKQQEPEHFALIRHILLPHEYLNFWLTGKMCAEFGDASGTAFFDVRSRTWQREALDFIDDGTGQLFSSLPQLIDSDSVVGTVRHEVAAELGLSTATVVSSGGGDNMMGAIGTGNIREGIVTLSLGTSSTVYSFSTRPPQDSAGYVAPFCSSSGGWLPLVCTMNATNVVLGTVSLTGKNLVDIDTALGVTEPGAGGLTFLPFLNGERTPDLPNARGSLLGISATNYDASNLLRAAVEGVTFGILNGLDLVLAGKPAESIQVIGGGARSSAWRQLLADATNTPITVPTEEESGCLGAAIQAMVAWSHLNGMSDTFQSATDRCARIDDAMTAKPRPAFLLKYDSARALYNERLRTLYQL